MTSWVTKTQGRHAGVNEHHHGTKDVTNIRHRVTTAQEIIAVTNVHLHHVTNVVIVTDEAETVMINVAIDLENVSGHDLGKTNGVTVQGHVTKSVANVLDRASVTIITNVITVTKITRMSFVITQSTEKRARKTSKLT